MADPTELRSLQEDGQASAPTRPLAPFPVRVGRSLWNAFREMPWPTKACASWLVLIVTAAIFADWIPGLQDPNYQGFLFGKGQGPEGPVHPVPTRTAAQFPDAHHADRVEHCGPHHRHHRHRATLRDPRVGPAPLQCRLPA